MSLKKTQVQLDGGGRENVCLGRVEHPVGPVHRRHSRNGRRQPQDQQGRVSGPVEEQGAADHQQTVTRRWIALDSLCIPTTRQNAHKMKFLCK